MHPGGYVEGVFELTIACSMVDCQHREVPFVEEPCKSCRERTGDPEDESHYNPGKYGQVKV